MGNLLDPLLALLVQDDGEDLPTRHALNFLGFTLTDDPAHNRINVEGGGGGGGVGMLAGDVEGNPDENIITTITGDGEDASVIMLAAKLLWDLDVSAGEAEFSISNNVSETGALQLIHNGKRALLASGDAPELGNDTGINRLFGGLRLTTRSIAVNTTLDTLIKDAIGWINASVERQVTLPPASVGRVLLLPFVGASAPTLKRLGTELINGAASNYAMEGDAAGGLAIAISDGANWVARTIRSIDTSGLAPKARLIATTAPLTGGGDLTADRTLGIDPAGFVAPTRTITATAPLTGGGDLSANRTIGIDTSGLAPTTRTIATAPPLTGGGDLSANRTIGIDTSGLVPVARAIAVTAPLTGGGDLSVNRTIGIDTAAIAPTTRSIATAAPLTGGGDLSADRTLAVSNATAIAVGVVQLAGNLGGTAAAPLATGLTADTITIQNANTTHKGVWTTVGLRIGDNTTPAEKLDVVGNGRFGAGTSKVLLGAYPGLENSYSTLWLGPITPSGANYLLFSNGTNDIRINAPSGQRISFRFAHSTVGAELTETGMRVGADGATPVERLEVVGKGQFGSGAAKVTAGGLTGSESTAAAIWLGLVTPSATNYAINGDTTGLRLNAPAATRVSMRVGNTSAAVLVPTGLRLSSDGADPTLKLEVDGASRFDGSITLGKSDFSSIHSINGALRVITIRSITANLTIDTTFKDLVVLADTTAGAITVTLPAVTGNTGRLIWVKRAAGTAAVLVARSSGAFVEASPYVQASLNTDPASSGIHPYLELLCDGTNWKVIRHFSVTLLSS